jgi:hypothetical protein
MWANTDVSKLIEQVALGDAEAYRKLTHLNSKQSNCIPVLLENLTHQDSSTRQAIAIGLANFTHLDFDPKWESEEKILECINSNFDDHVLKSSLLLALGSIGSKKSLQAILDIGYDSDSFTRRFALSAIGQSGALAYFLIDDLHQKAISSNDQLERAELGNCMKSICQEVFELVCDSGPLDLEELFINPQRFIKVPDKLNSPYDFNDQLKVILEDRIGYSTNGMNSSCRLTIISEQNQTYCIFTKDEFSFGTSPTNAIEFLMAAVANKFNFEFEDVMFLERYERGQFGMPEATIDMVVLDGITPGWIRNDIFIGEAKEKLNPYFTQPVPVPRDVNIDEKLRFYLPPCSRFKS